VVAGGVDDGGAAGGLDGQVIEVGVVVDQDGGDRLGLGLAGLGAGGQDLVAGLELADRDGGTGCEQDLRGAGERLATDAGLSRAVNPVVGEFIKQIRVGVAESCDGGTGGTEGTGYAERGERGRGD
jgi:hypothetical protein